ncbi:bifunctional nitrate reductase/sulfite reductase flavoprotein subunit alpha [Klebsiella sp. BIGb0407]|uniref:bifunctional nitrate reductase/sulfite reductase flavoprotein subunit alpha n=1 Tax=Klebsiella sp. BIGb0407 TaxID=2940603 RepID=UPI00216876AC|nr:bifunctional nitrate reductase/sulfite reductase flavoprotein subunit alpha [Klebsiella sp. BIGb0407]MCS3432447.1 sulfite reductase (NADPH) flavoprotein alpha-component [Klebsiella sp. BIGb0407]
MNIIPTISVKTVCPYCGVGCGMTLGVQGEKVIKVSGDKTHPTNFGRLCTKGSTSAQALRDSGRMESAFLRNDRQKDPGQTSMDIAITQTAQRLREILDREGPDAIALYVSGQMSLEAQYLANKLCKGYIGTNQIESNSRLCMASAGSGYKLSLGSDGPPGSYEDFDLAEVFFVIGANMADCHPILFLRMMDRVKAGAKLIVVDPRRNTTADKSHLFMQIKPGTDLALLNGLLYLLHTDGHTDPEFIAEYTEGWEAMPDFLADYTPDKVSTITGIPEEDIRLAAQMIGESGAWMSCWTMGLNQSTHGTWNTNAICNLHLATGAICKPGSGPFSLTGQPNAMGGREMGYMGPGLPGQRTVLVEEERDFVEDVWGIPRGTLHTRLVGGTVAMFERMMAGDIKACWVVCTNPVASVPNRKNVIAGLKKAELVITQDAFLDTETNRYADILLPAALWAEAEGVMINSERNLTLMQKAIDPPGQALPDWLIIARIACEMGFADAFSYASAEEIFEEIKQFWNPKTGYDIRGASYSRLRENPLQWPSPPGDEENRHPIRYLNEGISQKLRVRDDGSAQTITFATTSGKGVFLPRPHGNPAEMPDAEFPFVLNTGRLQHQWHTMTKTGKIPALVKLNSGPFIEIHPEDAAALGVKNKQRIEIRSRRGRAILPAVVTERVRAGNCFAPFHWNDLFGEDLAINAVTSDAIDPLSQQPEFKYSAVALFPLESESAPIFDTEASHPEGGSTSLDTVAVSEGTDPASIYSREHHMMQINTLGRLLNIDTKPVPDFDPHEQLYLQGFLTGLHSSEQEQNRGAVPALPVTAPLAPDKRVFIDGILAGLFSRAGLPGEVTHYPALTAEGASSSLLPESNQAVITVLWASQTGNVEAYASECVTQLESDGWEVNVQSMDNCRPEELPPHSPLLLLTSTFGDGDPPDNGLSFWQTLTSDTANSLNANPFSVLAFGDSSYDQFCGFGRKLDARMEALGAPRLVPRVDCEPEYHRHASDWMASVRQALKSFSRPDQVADSLVAAVNTDIKQTGPLPYSKQNPLRARLLQNRELNTAGASKETRQLVFDLKGSGLSYEAGDALGVWPTNCSTLVGDMLTALNIPAAASVTVKDLDDMSVTDAMLHHHEITRITPEVLGFIQEHSGSQELAGLLKPEHAAELKQWLWGKQIRDLLEEFPIRVSAQQWIAALRRLQPRLYSISSSPRVQTDEVHLTVSTVRYEHKGRPRGGVCSTFLADRSESVDIPIFVQKSAYFRPPSGKDVPMIMVGPGTGVAPFRGFLHERRARGDTGRNWLFFGEQHAETDFYYRDELLAMHQDGFLSQLSLAFSRDQEKKIYVQDRMREQGAQLWSWLQDGAHFYVCGDATRMAKDVDTVLRAVIQEHGGLSADAASDYVVQMSKDKRYVRDVY